MKELIIELKGDSLELYKAKVVAVKLRNRGQIRINRLKRLNERAYNN